MLCNHLDCVSMSANKTRENVEYNSTQNGTVPANSYSCWRTDGIQMTTLMSRCALNWRTEKCSIWRVKAAIAAMQLCCISWYKRIGIGGHTIVFSLRKLWEISLEMSRFKWLTQWQLFRMSNAQIFAQIYNSTKRIRREINATIQITQVRQLWNEKHETLRRIIRKWFWFRGSLTFYYYCARATKNPSRNRFFKLLFRNSFIKNLLIEFAFFFSFFSISGRLKLGEISIEKQRNWAQRNHFHWAKNERAKYVHKSVGDSNSFAFFPYQNGYVWAQHDIERVCEQVENTNFYSARFRCLRKNTETPFTWAQTVRQT